VLSAFSNLPFEQKTFAFKVAGTLYYHKLLLGVLSFSKILERSEDTKSLSTPSTISRQTAFELVERISKRLPGCDNCLLRSLVALKVSKNFEGETSLRIGVKNSDETPISAHAWLEDNSGEVIFEETPDLAKYSVLDRTIGQ